MTSAIEKLRTPRERKYYKRIFAAGIGGLTVFELYQMMGGANQNLRHGSVLAVCQELTKKGVVTVDITTDTSRMAPGSQRDYVNVFIAKEASQ